MYTDSFIVNEKVGWLLFSDKGLHALKLPKKGAKQPKNTQFKKNGLTPKLRAYFEGQKVAFNAKIDWSGYTDFEKQILGKCHQIAYGKVVSYKDLAKKSSKPNSSRAVGRALGKNRLPVIIGCHRVIRSDGNLGGFSYGLKTKKNF